MADAASKADEGRDETRAERIDRELIELLNELRVALPGVQFLFADRTLAWTTASVIAGLLVWWWMAVPLWQRLRTDDDGFDRLADVDDRAAA